MDMASVPQVCQGSTDGYLNLGTQSSATFHYNNETHNWVITYSNFIGNRQVFKVFIKLNNKTQKNHSR